MKKFCIVYWVDERKVSIENLKNVQEEARSVGSASDIKFQGGKPYHGKILKISENKEELTSEMKMVSIHEDGSVELATTKATTTTATTKATTTATTKATTKATTTATTTATNKATKTQKVQAVEAAAQVQKDLCRQMLSAQKEDEHSILKRENATLKRRVAELEVENKRLKANTGNQSNQSNQSFTMDITPKKIKLLKEITSFVSNQVHEEQKGVEKRPLQHLPIYPPTATLTASTAPTLTTALAPTTSTPPTPMLIAPLAPTPTAPPPPTLTAQFLNVQTPKASVSGSSSKPKQLFFAASGSSPSSHAHLEYPDETLVPLYPGGKPILRDGLKRQAFRKGQTKETLLVSLLEVVFGQETLAKGKACGLRVAPNKSSEEETVPLDPELLVEIKECILMKFRTSTGAACLSPKDFNTKINSKCASARRALKNKNK